ncbi:uncharacterized protein LOC143220516 [Lasioglossum baleicum]|uniref:uncharacterized protein LOC143220516 n=1 Tax=Lasioglossum baleicum TaxID=434251 RepID=UPI003FCEAA22
MALYGAPVSAEELMARRKNRANLASVWRRVTIRIATGYRNLTHEAAAVLAGLLPMDLLAATIGKLEEIEEMEREIRRSDMKRLQGRQRRPDSARHRAVGPIDPVLSGHECCGEYQHMVCKKITPGCWHCGAEVDYAQHTLEECPAWAAVKWVLQRLVGWDHSLHAIVPGMAGIDRVWQAVASFCE